MSSSSPPPVQTERRDLVLVTAGLGLDGGGRAVVGRLLAKGSGEYTRERGVGFRVLDLGDGVPPGLPGLAELSVRSLRGSRAALAAAVVRAQLAGPRRPALLFDLLGLARIQAVLPAALRGPYGLTVYGIEIWRPLGWSRRRAFRGAALPLAISRAALERARPYLPGGGDGVAVLPLALEGRPPAGDVDRGLLERLDAWAGDDPIALVVGRMGASERYKGHDELLAAWPRVRARVPAARLVIAGGGDDRRRLEAKVDEAGLPDSVLFTGFVSEATLDALYRRATLFALPSQGEGFGLVYLEAMRAGRPCVALAGTAAAEIVVPGETGLLVPAGDPDALAAALASLLADPERAARMGEAGRERWRSTFGYDRFRSRLAEHLDRLTA